MALAFTLFIAGMLTILLPCILPLIPIVLGVSVTGQSKWRPLMVIAGMLVSFVGFTFLLQTILRSFVETADVLRIGTYYVLVLFGFGFLTHHKFIQMTGALLGALMFYEKGVFAMIVAGILGIIAIQIGGTIATKIQQIGGNFQAEARGVLGKESPWTAFIIGLTLGLVWVPCAGPALSFAFTLVRDEPGLRAMLYLLCYGLGTSVPLLLIGYGGQSITHRVRAITPYTGIIKQISGAVLIITAIMLYFHAFERLQIWVLDHTSFGTLGTNIEERLFGDDIKESMFEKSSSPSSSMDLPILPKIARAPEFASTGPWLNSEPLTMSSLKGKVVLIDFWTYSCINCIRTLPYIEGYAQKFKNTPFVLVGVHTPEFAFEADPENVADAIKRHGLTYPVVQDNDFGTWRAFANRYWPAKYLIDANGYIRYTHFGEGNYEETDLAIQSLLKEIGVEVKADKDSKESEDSKETKRGYISPEIYLGERSWPTLANAQGGPTNEVVSYITPTTLALHTYALVGDWQLADGERQVLQSDTGEIRMQWQGGEINLVLGPGASTTFPIAEVWIDGVFVQTIIIDHHDLYALYTGAYGEHELVLKLKGKDVEGYAFTFGL